MRVATIGYQGARAGDIVAALQEVGIGILIDVRAVPWSRRPEFCRRALSETVVEAGLRYRHVPELGNPEAGREAARRGDVAAYRRIFRRHLDGRGARAALDELATLCRQEPVCLMCMERRPEDCHRAMVAEGLAGLVGSQVRHLYPGAQRELFG